MTIRNLSSRTLVFETAADYNDYVSKGGRLERFQDAFLAFATAGQAQWIRGVGDVITAAETTQVSGASAGGTSGYTKTQVTAVNTALTWAAHNRRIVHVEAPNGSLASLLAANWKDAASAFLEGDFYIQNHTGATITFDVTTGAGGFTGFVELGGDEQVSGFAIPDKYLAHVFVDPDGFVQITLSGEAVTQAELTAGLNLKQDSANRVVAVTSTSTDAQYPSAKLLYDHVAGRRGTIGAAITASVTLTAWDDNRDVDATAGGVVVTLPAVATQDGEITISRRDNTANVVVVTANGLETMLNVPAGTTHVALLPGGSVTFRATAGGPAKKSWAQPQSASRLWLPTTADLPTVLGWWDARSITALAEGALIAAWSDSSGAGRNAAQATDANKPTYRTAGINSLPAVEVAAASRMDAGSYGVDEMSAAFLWTTPASFPADARIFGPAASGGALAFRYGGGVNFLHTGVAHMANAATLQQASVTELRSASFSDATNALVYRRNGAADGTGTYAGDVPTTSATLRLFAEVAIGPPVGARFAGLVLASTALAAADLERIEGALAHRCGLQATVLAAAHPYRNVPPLAQIVGY